MWPEARERILRRPALGYCVSAAPVDPPSHWHRERSLLAGARVRGEREALCVMRRAFCVSRPGHITGG